MSLILIRVGLAQDLSSWSFEVQQGVIIPHSEELARVAQSHPMGIKVSFEEMPTSKDAWSNCNCFHYLGLNLSYHDFRNPDILGKGITLSGSFEPLLWHQKKWQVTLKTAIGVSYLTKVYDVDTNPENLFFSSPISFMMSVSPKIRYRLSDHLSTYLSLNYNHISNGGQSQPNKGMNFPMIGWGFSYLTANIPLPSYEPERLVKKMTFLVDFLGTNRNNPKGGGRVGSFGVSLDANYQFSYLNGFGGGLEANWDKAVELLYGKRGYIQGVYLAHHLMFGRFDFSQRMGLYLIKPPGYIENKFFFQRYILNYNVLKNTRVGLGIKAHGHVAENMEVRLGYEF
ncbi:MAG: acyloxyacyl hydrolase [Cyclobacteriaceae bacterium]